GLHIDRDKAGRIGLSPLDIDQTLYDAFGQRQIATIYGDSDQYQVVLEISALEQMETEALQHVYLRTPDGSQVALRAIATIAADLSPLTVTHQVNSQRSRFPSILRRALSLVRRSSTSRRRYRTSACQARFAPASRVGRGFLAHFPVSSHTCCWALCSWSTPCWAFSTRAMSTPRPYYLPCRRPASALWSRTGSAASIFLSLPSSASSYWWAS